MNFIINVFKFHLKNVYLCSEKAFATKFLFLVKHFRPAWKNENDVRKGHYTNFFNFQFEIYLPFLLLNSYSTQRITSTFPVRLPYKGPTWLPIMSTRLNDKETDFVPRIPAISSHKWFFWLFSLSFLLFKNFCSYRIKICKNNFVV